MRSSPPHSLPFSGLRNAQAIGPTAWTRCVARNADPCLCPGKMADGMNGLIKVICRAQVTLHLRGVSMWFIHSSHTWGPGNALGSTLGSPKSVDGQAQSTVDSRERAKISVGSALRRPSSNPFFAVISLGRKLEKSKIIVCQVLFHGVSSSCSNSKTV